MSSILPINTLECTPESTECLKKLSGDLLRRSVAKMSSRSAVEFNSLNGKRVAVKPRRKSAEVPIADFGDEFPITEIGNEFRCRGNSPSPGERRRLSLDCRRNAKNMKIGEINAAKAIPTRNNSNLNSVVPSSPMILMSGLSEAIRNSAEMFNELCKSTQCHLKLSSNDPNNNNEMVSSNYGDEAPKTPTTPSPVQLECDFDGAKQRNKSIGSEDDDFEIDKEKESEFEAAKRRNELFKSNYVHFIRSPTDGVFLPIFKKKDTKDILEEIDEITNVNDNNKNKNLVDESVNFNEDNSNVCL